MKKLLGFAKQLLLSNFLLSIASVCCQIVFISHLQHRYTHFREKCVVTGDIYLSFPGNALVIFSFPESGQYLYAFEKSPFRN